MIGPAPKPLPLLLLPAVAMGEVSVIEEVEVAVPSRLLVVAVVTGRINLTTRVVSVRPSA